MYFQIGLLIAGLAWSAICLLLVAIVTYFEGGKPWKKPSFLIAIGLAIAATFCDAFGLAYIYTDYYCPILPVVSKIIALLRGAQSK